MVMVSPFNRVSMVFLYGYSRLLDVGREHGPEENLDQHYSILAQDPQQCFCNVCGHTDETGICLVLFP
jgi:hypothetical protein